MENTMDNEIKYRTLDLYEAAYVEEKGVRLLDVQVHAGGQHIQEPRFQGVRVKRRVTTTQDVFNPFTDEPVPSA